MSISLLQINESVGRFLTALAGGLVNVAWSPRTAESAGSRMAFVRAYGRSGLPLLCWRGGRNTWEQFEFRDHWWTPWSGPPQTASGRRYGAPARNPLRGPAPAEPRSCSGNAGSGESIEFVLSPELVGSAGRRIPAGESATKTPAPAQLGRHADARGDSGERFPGPHADADERSVGPVARVRSSNLTRNSAMRWKSA